jgi:autotransporter-associated beta strand protein
MKPRILNTFRLSLPLAAAIAALLAARSANAATYYWDNNTTTAGYGTASGTWTAPTVAQWSTSSTGVFAPGNITTATGDTMFFGYLTTGLGAGTINVSGTVNASELIFSAGSGAIVLSGGTINFSPIFVARNLGSSVTGTVLVNTPSGAEIQSSITGASLVFAKSVAGNPETTVGGPLTLSGANTFAGPTINRVGILVLNNSLALQNSSLHTTSSASGTSTAGLTAAVTSLTLGGLEGSRNLASLFTTTSGGFSGITDLTLNPGANRLEVYSGGIADGAAGMNLIKTGNGTQVFSGSNSYTGTTTVSSGILSAKTPSALPGYDSLGKVVFGGGTIAASVGGAGWSTAQVDTLLSNATKTSGSLGIDTTNGNLTQWTAFTAGNLGSLGLHKIGGNTLTLNTANTYTGTTTVGAGTLAIQNPGTGLAQTLGLLSFSGSDATIQSDYNSGSGILSTTFGTISRTPGSAANLVISGGTNGTDNLINLTGASGFIDKGIFFGGADYAALETLDGFVRALAYGSDTDAETTDTITASKHVKLTASPAARPGDSLLSLNFAGSSVDYTMNSGTLTTPAILKAGGGTSIISGGTAVTDGTGTELVIRTDGATDQLTVSTAVTGTGGLTKSGAGKLVLSSTGSSYSGDTFVNAGTIETARTSTYTGNIFIEQGASFHHTGGTFIHNGLISGGGTLIKSGAGTLTLNGANGFTGGTIINGGTIAIQKIFDDAFGTGGDITFNASAELAFSSAPTQSSYITFNRGLVLNSGAIAKFSYSGNATITGPVTGTGGIWSSNTNNTQNTLNLLSTANTFTGQIQLNQTNIQPNTIVLNSLADSASLNKIIFGSTTGTITFRWGSGAIAPLVLNNRQFELTQTTGGSVIENANTNAANTITVNTDLLVTGAGNKPLTFTGVNTGNNTFDGNIVDGTSAVISVTKSSTGTWILSGNNTHTGLTTVSGGILTLSGNNSSMTGGVTVTSSRLNIGSAQAVGTGTLSIGGTAPSIDNTSGSALTIASNNAQSWNGDFTFAGSNSLNLGTGAVALGSTRNVTVTASTLTVGGVISGVAPRGIQKSGAGTLLLAGANSYGGDTTISGGTLAMGAGNVLPDTTNLSIGNATLNASTFTDTAGTLDVTGAAIINVDAGGTVAFADSNAIDWSGGSLNITGTFVSGSSIRFGSTSGGLLPAQLAVISVNGAGAGTYSLDTNGFLVSVASNTYADWLTANAPATGFDTDTDNDGVSNGAENVLGSNPNTYSAGLTEVSSTANSVVFKHTLNPTIASDVSYSYQWSTDLVEWKTSGETNTGGTTTTIVASPPVLGVVTVTVNITSGPSAKLFGRLVATKP